MFAINKTLMVLFQTEFIYFTYISVLETTNRSRSRFESEVAASTVYISAVA